MLIYLTLITAILLTYFFSDDFYIRQRDSIQQHSLIQNRKWLADIGTEIQFAITGAADRALVDQLLNGFSIAASLPLTSTYNEKAHL